MKKTLLMIPAALMLLTSCSNDDPTLIQTWGMNAYNLITPVDENAAAYVQNGSYTFENDVYNATVKVGVNNVTVNNQSYKFTTSELPTKGSGYSFSFSTPYVYLDNGVQVQSLSGLVTSLVNGPANLKLESIPGISGVSDFGRACAVTFEISNVASVASFPREAYYTGKTDTTYPGGVSTSDDIVYRVILDMEKSKALMVIYGAKFAEGMPKMTFILRDLDFKAVRGGYTLTGANVVPETADGALYPNFAFDNLTFRTTNKNLTEASFDFSVAGRFTGAFSGSYLIKISD